MGVVALVLLAVSIICAAVSGGLQAPPMERVRTWYPWLAGGRVMSRIHAHQPPERKSVVIDITGQSQLTADRTSPTKRDRSRLYPHLEVRSVPVGEEGVSIPLEEALVPARPPVLSAPLRQGQIEEISLPTPGPALFRPPGPIVREPSLGRKVQQALLADPALSRSLQLTLRASSIRDRVTLRGIVLNGVEKEYVGTKAEGIAGAGNVDNRLIPLYDR